MLTNSNSKLGKSIWVWNLPAGSTCPGATQACSEVCYAKKTERIYPNARKAYSANYQKTLTDGWTDEIIRQIKAKGIKTVRIHANGDFYGAEYILDWTHIATSCPDTLFFAYTRSWAIAGMLPALDSLKSLPNAKLLASVDWTSPEPPNGWRIARMLDKTTTKSINAGYKLAGLICLEQTGKADNCGDCKVCFNYGKSTINFMLH